MVRSWRLGLLIALSTCGLLSADRLAVQLRGGAKVSKAKRGKSAKKLEVHAYAADAPGLRGILPHLLSRRIFLR